MYSRESSPLRVQAPADEESGRRRRKHHRSDERRPRGASRDQEPASTRYHYEIPPTIVRPPRIVTQSDRRGENDSRSPSSSADRIDVGPEQIVVTAHQSGRRSSQRADSISSHSPRKVTRYEVSKPPLSRSHSYAVPEPPPATSHQRSWSSHRAEAASSSLKRSDTVRSTRSRSSSRAPSLSNVSIRGSRALGSFFGLASSREPERVVECLTCGDDEIVRSRSAKLKCGHRMCNSCLRRIFKMSMTDPQHMPPRCCTEDHISLKHVEHLFDDKFKRNWNRKFQEFSTQNRIYCPDQHCGEWIKPTSITRSSSGKKYGTCGRCALRVCCECSGRYHGRRHCLRDEETKKLLRQAKDAGWQRCYNCRTLVELKEGCNHMTCRCQAQFCMICARKWKTCDCPCFNYTTPSPDDVLPSFGGDTSHPLAYESEPVRRRFSEREDAHLAQRLDSTVLREAAPAPAGQFAPEPDVHDGHARGFASFKPDYYQRPRVPLTSSRPPYTTLPPAFRRSTSEPPAAAFSPRRGLHRIAGWHSMRETVVPRRDKGDYHGQAHLHAPLPKRQPTASDLAGLPGRGSGRVETWRMHVQAGEPEGGALSI